MTDLSVWPAVVGLIIAGLSVVVVTNVSDRLRERREKRERRALIESLRNRE